VNVLGRTSRPASSEPVAPVLDRGGAEVFVDDVCKTFGVVRALCDVTLRVSPGEMLAITGHSGSGKSTLLNLIGGLDQPTNGRILIDGEAVWAERHTARHRRDLVGFVFQHHLLLPNLTARGNVEVPLIGAGPNRAARHAIAEQLLDEVGLSARAEHLPAELSGGERQRVAVARALANSPRLLLADEPTGALDSATAARVLDLLGEARARRGMTTIMVTYDPEVGERADRMVYMTDGHLQDSPAPGIAAPSRRR